MRIGPENKRGPHKTGFRNCAFDTSIEFGAQSEYVMRDIFGYLAMAVLSLTSNCSHFEKYEKLFVMIPIFFLKDKSAMAL